MKFLPSSSQVVPGLMITFLGIAIAKMFAAKIPVVGKYISIG